MKNKKKLLFISNYHSTSGWGLASRDYIKSLQTIDDLDITIRPIYPDNNLVEYLDFELIKYQEKSAAHYDFLIQKVLPMYITYDARCGQNILLTVTETTNFKYYGWTSKFNMVDKIFVPDTVGKKYIGEVTETPVFNIGEPVPPCETKGKHGSIISNAFNFLFIGEDTGRKNLRTLLRAYLMEFDKHDQVNLVVKTSKPGLPPHEHIKELMNYVEMLKKQELRRFINLDLYAPVQLVLDHIEDIYTIHNSCHCLIVPSRGEAFCRPAAESLMVGNPVICTNHIGTCDFINDTNGWIIDSKKIPCGTKQPPIQDWYTCNELWFDLDINSLRRTMRKAYNEYKHNQFKDKKQPIKNTAEKLTYGAVGNRLAEALEI